MDIFRERQTDAYTKSLNELLKSYFYSEEKELKKKLKDFLKMDEINFCYFLLLLRLKHKKIANEFIIVEGTCEDNKNKIPVLPTAIASKNDLNNIPLIEYESLLLNNEYKNASKDVALCVKKMHAGLGSSIERTRYLQKRFSKKESEVKMSAKGLDLWVTIPSTNHEVSLAELQLIKLIVAKDRKEFGKIIFHDLVGPETNDAIKNLWKKSSPFWGKLTYKDLLDQSKDMRYSGITFQDHLPTINEKDELTYMRHAPGGHALFGIETLLNIAKSNPDNDKEYIISAISNGEDLSASPDSYMLGWMKKNNIPIVMVTTDKTEIDTKGGQIVIVKKDNLFYLTLLELAQAERAGQKKLFEELGLREGDKKVFFNTNMILFNHNVLKPRLRNVLNDVGEEKFLEIIAPDLILNKKEQLDDDGILRNYYQMEGAIGSVILNLDKFWRQNYATPIVYFINVGRNLRTDFFSPIKTPFDFFMQFNSDRFSLDKENFSLINNRRSKLPLISLKGGKSYPHYYNDLEIVLEAFNNTSIIELDELTIEGPIKIDSAILKGKVILINELNTPSNFSKLAIESSKIPILKGKPLFENILCRLKSDQFCISPIT